MNRIPSLDGLRAICILSVLFGHLVYGTNLHSEFTDAYAHAGVLTFFIISGFLITSLTLRDQENNRFTIRGFYIRRAWRILPSAFVYLAVITIVDFKTLSIRDLSLAWGYMASYATFFGQFPWNFSHLWSLSVEEQFYLLWPIVIALGGLMGARAVAWSWLLISPIIRYWFNHHGMYLQANFTPMAVMDSISAGCLMALYAGKLERFVSQNCWVGTAWIPAAVMPFLMNVGSYHWFHPLPQILGHARWSLFNFFAALGIMWAIQSKTWILNNRIMVWIGMLSYSLYLFSMPLMNPDYRIPIWLRLAGSFAVASFSYYLIEQPVLNFRAKLKLKTA